MPFQTSTLRPGILVSLKTTIQGNVAYEKETIEEEHVTSDGSALAEWKTKKTVDNPEEHKKATEARSKARHAIAKVCTSSAFGMLCPESRVADLEAAIIEARKIAVEFNETSSLSKIGVYVITGRVAQDDVEAVRAINSEVRDLMLAMERGVAKLEPAAIREAANKAKNLGQMLSADAAERIQEAISIARQAASRIAKGGEVAQSAVNKAVVDQLGTMRTQFLDLDDAQEMQAVQHDGRAVDFDTEDAPSTAGPLVEAARNAIELDAPIEITIVKPETRASVDLDA